MDTQIILAAQRAETSRGVLQGEKPLACLAPSRGRAKRPERHRPLAGSSFACWA